MKKVRLHLWFMISIPQKLQVLMYVSENNLQSRVQKINQFEFGTMQQNNLKSTNTRQKNVWQLHSIHLDSTSSLLCKIKFKWWMFSVTIWLHSNQSVLKAVQKFSSPMEVIYLLLFKEVKLLFTTFGREKADQHSCLKVIMVELNAFFGMMMILDSIVLLLMETCMFGTFKTITKELMNMSIHQNLFLHLLLKFLRWTPVIWQVKRWLRLMIKSTNLK